MQDSSNFEIPPSPLAVPLQTLNRKAVGDRLCSDLGGAIPPPQMVQHESKSPPMAPDLCGVRGTNGPHPVFEPTV